jgi:hypothetical protein
VAAGNTVEPEIAEQSRRAAAVRWMPRVAIVVVFGLAAIIFLNLVFHSGIVGSRPGRVLFTDVAATYPLRPQIEQIARLGILPGLTETLFVPKNPVTRAQLAESIVRTKDWSVGANEKQPFKDVGGSSGKLDSADYIAVAAAHGVMGKASDNPPKFKPDDKATLGQTVLALVRAGGKTLKQPTDFDPALAKLQLPTVVSQALSIAETNGLFTGSGLTLATLKVGDPVTREQLAVMLSNFRKVVPATP